MQNFSAFGFGTQPQQQRPLQPLLPWPNQAQQQPLQLQQQQQQQQQQQNVPNRFAEQLSRLAVAVTNPLLYGDERDQIITKLNQLLAFCGVGKGYFDNNALPIDFSSENPFCRFHAIGYNRLTGHKNEHGFVAMIFNKNASTIEKITQQIIDGIFKIMGNRPQLSLSIENIKPLPNEKCEALVYVTETDGNGVKRRITSVEAYNFFSQATTRAQLQELGIIDLAVKVDLPPEQLESYLAAPPSGIDRTVWKQAQDDNPDPMNLLPWPIVGFSQLRERQLMQQQETSLQQGYTQKLASRLVRIDQNTLACQATLAQLKVKKDQLSNRVLKIVGAIIRRSRQGHSLDASEEQLQSRLENIFIRLNGPLQIKGRLSEVLSQFRSRSEILLSHQTAPLSDDALKSKLVDETKQHLKKYQDGLEELVELVQQDFADLDVIKEALQSSKARWTLRK